MPFTYLSCSILSATFSMRFISRWTTPKAFWMLANVSSIAPSRRSWSAATSPEHDSTCAIRACASRASARPSWTRSRVLAEGGMVRLFWLGR